MYTWFSLIISNLWKNKKVLPDGNRTIFLHFTAISHINNKSAMIITDTSAKQKKYLYDLLIQNGFDSALLYRKFTTQPRLE